MPQHYQGTLLVWAVTSFCVIFNVFLAKRLPFVEGVLLTIYVRAASNTQHFDGHCWDRTDPRADVAIDHRILRHHHPPLGPGSDIRPP